MFVNVCLRVSIWNDLTHHLNNRVEKETDCWFIWLSNLETNVKCIHLMMMMMMIHFSVWLNLNCIIVFISTNSQKKTKKKKNQHTSFTFHFFKAIIKNDMELHAHLPQIRDSKLIRGRTKVISYTHSQRVHKLVATCPCRKTTITIIRIIIECLTRKIAMCKQK